MKENKLRREEVQDKNQKKKGEWWDGTKHTKSMRTDIETVDLAITESVRRKQHIHSL